jgi:crossover junction endodeoxyribonuclease RuvC
MITIGCDPGLTGALAVLRQGAGAMPELIEIVDMPVITTRRAGKASASIDAEALAAALAGIVRRHEGVEHFVIERVSASPGAGVAGMFKFGRSAGLVEGMAWALGLRVTSVPPAVWKGALRLGRDKGESRRAAAIVWPGQAHLFERVRDDGRAEAGLIGLHAIRVSQASAGRVGHLLVLE